MSTVYIKALLVGPSGPQKIYTKNQKLSYTSMETFILQSNEIDSLGACSYGTLRSADLLPRLANYLSIALDTIEVRFENAGLAYADFQQNLLSEYRHLVAEAVEFHELNADGYGSAYVDSVEMDAQEIIVSLFDALDQLSPENQYFGSHPGDGSDFGYWESYPE